MTTPLRTLALAAVFLAASIYLPILLGGSAPADPCDSRPNDTTDELLECVTLDGVRAHQAALQAIADTHHGNRLTGTSGYEASVAYVAETLTTAGYTVTLDPFPFRFVPPPLLQQLTPVDGPLLASRFGGTGTGDVTAPVTAVDINLTPPRATSSGCETADFAAFPAGHIALIQRGGCDYTTKATHALAAGAAAIIFFNQGDNPEREGLLFGSLGAAVSIPVAGARFDTGVALSAPDATARLIIDPIRDIIVHNVLAETRGGDPDRIVMAGAHLDSVAVSPGIQDNGSGVAALLEVAQQMARVDPVNKVRFAWWGAEEALLAGSIAYVNQLPDEELARIALYLNFDMIGSPNYGLFVLDGDDSDGVGGGPGPDGSAAIEQLFIDYYAGIGQPVRGVDFTGRSDYAPFVAKGIPAGGVFTGSTGIKTTAQVALWGGVAGQPLDPCYHRPCDTYDNISLFALDINADAVAYSVLQYAMNTQAINGQRGKGNFKPAPEAQPAD